MKKLLQKELLEFSGEAKDWFLKNDWIAPRIEFFNNLFSMSNLVEAEWEDFQKMGDMLHSFSSNALTRSRALGEINHPIERYRKTFQYIKHDPAPVNVKINELLYGDSELQLFGFGEATVIELIVYANPDQYVLYNSRDRAALEHLDLKLEQKFGEKTGDTFLRYNQKIVEIISAYRDIVGQQTSTTIQMEVDQFLSWLYGKNKSKQNMFANVIEELKEYIKNKNDILAEFTFLKTTKKNYVQIKDAEKCIGSSKAHYEIMSQKNGDIYVDLHFESKDQREKEVFSNNIQLPEELMWIPWQHSKSIRVSNPINITDGLVVEHLYENLLLMENSIGDSVRSILKNEIHPKAIESAHELSLHDSIIKILDNWVIERRKPFNQSSFAHFMRIDFTAVVSKIVHRKNPSLLVQASPGAGNWANIPWCSILDKRITTSTQEGIYPVFLFKADGSGVYLSLNQGTTKPQKILGKEGAMKQAQKVINDISNKVEYLRHLDQKKLLLNASTPLGKSYEYPNIGAYYYERNTIPPNEDLERDLLKMVDIYEMVVQIHQDLAEDKPIATSLSANTVNMIPISKPFILLAGISGTGKTRFVRKQAEQSCPNAVRAEKYNYCLVPVRPDWHEPSDLLGYVSRINGTKYIATDFLKFMVKALAASIESVDDDGIKWKDFDSVPPFWLCLDEMNLAPVEQYFSDYLSILETRDWNNGEYKSDPMMSAGLLKQLSESALADGTNSLEALWSELFEGVHTPIQADLGRYFLEKGIPLPPNLIVAGTVNMDETTHGFSRKVIDRALTLDFQEFFRNDYDSFFIESKKPNVLTFPRVSQAKESVFEDVNAVAEKERSIEFLKALNSVLLGTPFELAFRALNELLISVQCFAPYDDESKYKLDAVWDDFLMQKILPRIEGDTQKLKYIPTEGNKSSIKGFSGDDKSKFGSGSILHQLYFMLKETHLENVWEDSKRPDLLRETDDKIGCRSKLKLEWMMKRLKANHFTDFRV